MDVELQNRIARKLLETLHYYSREFGGIDTVAEPDTFGLTAGQFRRVVARLEMLGLAEPSGEEDCTVTLAGLSVAKNVEKLNAFFPISTPPDEPLPSELELFGERSFEVVDGHPKAMSEAAYHDHVWKEWNELLASANLDDERIFQDFLEKHPCLLPQCYDFGQRGATPQLPFYYTQPELPGFRSKIPDFMTIMWDSEAVIAWLIEIEAPGKPWATASGQEHHKLKQAINQLIDWKTWFSEPENRIQFCKLYRINERILETRQFLQRYVLIYGRASEAEANPVFAKKRAFLSHSDQVFMTYDRLRPNTRMHWSPTVKLDRKQTAGLRVLHVPPTLQIGPYNADPLARLSGLVESVAANTLMTPERREFLLKRIPYWKEWLAKPLVISENGFQTSQFYSE